jgi:hypothetical protein
MTSRDAEKLLAAFCGACLAFACSGSGSTGPNGGDGGSSNGGAEGGSGGASSGGSASTSSGAGSSGGASSSGSAGSSGSTGGSGSTSSGAGSGSGASSSTSSNSSSGSPVDGGSRSGHCTSTSCASPELCVQSQVAGGAVIFPDDAGACPAGREVGASGHCDDIPTYTCVQRPAACTGAISCACASALCPQNFMCQSSASTTFVSCVEAVP